MSSYLLQRRCHVRQDEAFPFDLLNSPRSFVSKLIFIDIYEENLSELLEFTETIRAVVISIIEINLIETMSFTEAIEAEGFYFVGDTLSLQENFGYYVEASDTLTFIEDYQLEYPLVDQLSLQEKVNTEYAQTVTDILYLVDILYNASDSLCLESYSPVPPLGVRGETTLMYPYTGSTHTAILRNPEFGNKQTQDTSSVTRFTRGGDQVTFRDSTWPVIQYLELSFKGITRVQRDNFIELLEAAAGDEIKLIDWENRTWKGHIASEPNEVLQMSEDDGNYEIRFKFEGALQ